MADLPINNRATVKLHYKVGTEKISMLPVRYVITNKDVSTFTRDSNTITHVLNYVGQVFLKCTSQQNSDAIKGSDCTLTIEVGLLTKMAGKSMF